MQLKTIFIPTLLTFALAVSCSAFASDPQSNNAIKAPGPLATIARLDVPRYLGTWFEIAKYPNWFQKKCVGDTKASYSPQSDGKVRVINRCMTKDGEVSEAAGEARQIGDATSPRLEVRFAPHWLSFIPLVWGNYWVIDLDPDYQLVAVSEPKREYLWVLSRTPEVSAKAYDELLARLEKKGFDLSKLERTRHGK